MPSTMAASYIDVKTYLHGNNTVLVQGTESMQPAFTCGNDNDDNSRSNRPQIRNYEDYEYAFCLFGKNCPNTDPAIHRKSALRSNSLFPLNSTYAENEGRTPAENRCTPTLSFLYPSWCHTLLMSDYLDLRLEQRC